MALCKNAGSVMKSSMIALLVLVGLLSRANATLYTVGGASGWIELQPGSLSYNAQFKDVRLKVGDQLFFAFQEGVHNVYQVPSTAVGACNATNPIAIFTATNATITLSSPGFWGFICEVSNHCSESGMRLGVTVQSSGAPPAGPAPTLTPAYSTAAPEPSMASPATSPSEASLMGDRRGASEMYFSTSEAHSLASTATSVIFFASASAFLALFG